MDILNLIIKELKHYEDRNINTCFIPVTSKYKYYEIIEECKIDSDIVCIQSKYIIKLISSIIKLIKKYTSDININFCECDNDEILSIVFFIKEHRIRVEIKSIYNRIHIMLSSEMSLTSLDSLVSLDEDTLDSIIKNLIKN